MCCTQLDQILNIILLQRCRSKNGSALNRVPFHSYIKTFFRARARRATMVNPVGTRAYLCTHEYIHILAHAYSPIQSYIRHRHRDMRTHIHPHMHARTQQTKTRAHTHTQIDFFANVFMHQFHSLRCRSFSRASAAVQSQGELLL